MGLTMRERHAVIREVSSRFQRARKKERSQILDDFVQLTGYTRCYAAFVLRNCGKKHLRMVAGRRVVFIPGQARAAGSKRERRGSYRTKPFLEALTQFWALSDGLCGKRLTVFIREVLPLLERQGRLTLADGTVRSQLLHVSPATADRLLAKTKRQSQLKARSGTRPGSLLKYHIAIRTFADWNELKPGFCEADLVAHDGGSAFGDYCQTLTLTDVASCWSETESIKNKAQIHVFAALKEIRARLPFPLLGLDSDNGSEFINNELLRYCEAEQITFTRSRPYRKNDNCFVEQKNYSLVRRSVGYYRYDSPHQLHLLRMLYARLRLYSNFFLPVMKLKEKVRIGAKVTRRYDQPKTPFRRVLDHPLVQQPVKDALQAQYQSLDVTALKRELNQLQKLLVRTAIRAGAPPQPPRCPPYPGPNHPWRTHNIGPSQSMPAGDSSELPASKQKPIDLNKKNTHSLHQPTSSRSTKL
jgi:hypothetical protein